MLIFPGLRCGLLLILLNVLLLAGLRRILHRLGGLRIGLVQLIRGLAHAGHRLLGFIRELGLRVGGFVQLVAILGVHLIGLLAEILFADLRGLLADLLLLIQQLVDLIDRLGKRADVLHPIERLLQSARRLLLILLGFGELIVALRLWRGRLVGLPDLRRRRPSFRSRPTGSDRSSRRATDPSIPARWICFLQADSELVELARQLLGLCRGGGLLIGQSIRGLFVGGVEIAFFSSSHRSAIASALRVRSWFPLTLAT